MTYKFPEHNVTITPITIEVDSVTYKPKNKITMVDVKLSTENCEYITTISGNDSPEIWEMTAIQKWVNDKLKDYETQH